MKRPAHEYKHGARYKGSQDARELMMHSFHGSPNRWLNFPESDSSGWGGGGGGGGGGGREREFIEENCTAAG
jgi:hypothetical protein